MIDVEVVEWTYKIRNMLRFGDMSWLTVSKIESDRIQTDLKE